MATRNTKIPPGLVALALALCAMIPGLARAQVSDIDPYYVVVEAEGATLRSGDLRNYYPIADNMGIQAGRLSVGVHYWRLGAAERRYTPRPNTRDATMASRGAGSRPS